MRHWARRPYGLGPTPDDMISIEASRAGNRLPPPLQQLQTYLDQFSNRSTIATKLRLWNVVITRRMITLLLPLLLCEDDEETSRGCRSKKIPPRFSSVSIQRSIRFFSSSDVKRAKQAMDVCTHEDKVSFLVALSRGPKKLEIGLDCPDIVSNLLQIPEIARLEVQRLEICQRSDLRDEEYVQLGAMIQRSVQMTDLSLSLPFVNAPRDFYNTLANATHLQTLYLRIHGDILPFMPKPQFDAIMSNLIVGDNGNGVVERLLRNPQNQLTHLNLSSSKLEDHHLIALAQLLPTSHVKKIELQNNNIQPPGLLEFFRRLPNMRSLNSMNLGYAYDGRGRRVETDEECLAALLHALIENPFITRVDYFNYDLKCPLSWHYVTLNRAGRRILTSDYGPPIPDGLWPMILARAGKDKGVCFIRIYEKKAGGCVYNGPANAVFFFLQNYPKLCAFRVLQCNQGKDTGGPSNPAYNSKVSTSPEQPSQETFKNLSVVKVKTRKQHMTKKRQYRKKK